MAAKDKIIGASIGSSKTGSISSLFINGYLGLVTEKINSLVNLVYDYDSSGKGGVSASSSDPRYTLPVSFESEPGISPIETGLDGTSIYTFSSNELTGGTPKFRTMHPIFWKQNPSDATAIRPNTIYETFLALNSKIETQLSDLRSLIGRTNAAETISPYTKEFIGYRAFAPGGSLNTGSLAWQSQYLTAKINEIRKDVFGPQHALRTGLDDTRQSTYSLLQIADTLLALHGGEEYLSEYVWPEPMTLTHATAPTVTPPSKVQYISAGEAERLIEDDSLTSLTTIRLVPDINKSAYLLDATDINALFDDQEYTKPILPLVEGHVVNRLSTSGPRLWSTDEDNTYLLTSTNFTVNLNSDPRRLERQSDLKDDVKELSEVSFENKFFNPADDTISLSLIYEVEMLEDSEDTEQRILIGNTVNSHLRNHIEITLHGMLTINPALASASSRINAALYKSLENNGDFSEGSLRPGINKVLIARDLAIGAFDRNTLGGRNLGDLLTSNQLYVDLMKVNVMHKALSLIEDTEVKRIKLLGLEVCIEKLSGG
jgi:hypothetical protein